MRVAQDARQAARQISLPRWCRPCRPLSFFPPLHPTRLVSAPPLPRGIDFIKNDCTFAANMDADNIRAVSAAMDKTGHDFVYSLSPGAGATLQQARNISDLVNQYRITGDWHGPEQAHGCGPWEEHLQQATVMQSAIAARGHKGKSWPDLDMLAASMQNDNDHLLEMSLWSVMRSPLFIGMDFRNKTAEDLWWYTNKEVRRHVEPREAERGKGHGRPAARRGSTRRLFDPRHLLPSLPAHIRRMRRCSRSKPTRPTAAPSPTRQSRAKAARASRRPSTRPTAQKRAPPLLPCSTRATWRVTSLSPLRSSALT